MFKKLIFGGDGGASPLADIGLLLLRLFAGLSLALSHGWGKVQDPSRIIEGTKQLGIPAPGLMGVAAMLSEFLGGLLLAIGLATRPAAFLIACTMGVAAAVAHGSDPYAKKELALCYFAMAVCFLFTGSGRYGADAMFFRRRRGGQSSSRGFEVK
jgi:putative oxidoreductase